LFFAVPDVAHPWRGSGTANKIIFGNAVEHLERHRSLIAPPKELVGVVGAAISGGEARARHACDHEFFSGGPFIAGRKRVFAVFAVEG
jgi:hypothetical protein